ncbi:putative serine-O-acetyltransferase cys2 [Trichoplax sp. H2]|nr:putative serine-O-acetyltransferase cys2 [Trichoplax sp. H2]|eukprot:RDD42157.1 putative serine-O-acetyltransferase cys2 [Trichoplax sp. H2]
MAAYRTAIFRHPWRSLFCRRWYHRSASLTCNQKTINMPQVEIPPLDHLDTSDPVFEGNTSDFPCLQKFAPGPEPNYEQLHDGYEVFRYDNVFKLKHGVLPKMQIAYETWGTLNERKDNTVLLQTGISASSHARSTEKNRRPGWWEDFIGPGKAVDTNKFFVICTNLLGGCFGSTGPSSINPITDSHYATTFPIVTIPDAIRAQFLLLDHLGINKIHAAVGSSMGGMQALATAALYSDRVNRIISISGCVKPTPTAIALRYLQRRVLMTDPNWNSGYYYNGIFPKRGMKLAREIGTIGYRSGPEWETRFGHRKRTEEPSFCPQFEIEEYIEHQGEKFSLTYDPNTLLYLSKAIDLFDIGEGFPSMVEGVKRIICPTLVIGVKTDILFPIQQQTEIADLLKQAGNQKVTYYELNSIYGHDTFLLDINNVGAAVKGHLESQLF